MTTASRFPVGCTDVRGRDGRLPVCPHGQALPIYEFTCQLATLESPPPELAKLLGAVHDNQDAIDGFAKLNAGVMSPVEFFSDENVGRIVDSAPPRSALQM